MYKSMLVPLDGSELAEVVLPYAEELAARLRLEVVCLHVYGVGEDDPASVHRAYVERVADSVTAHTEEIQRQMGSAPRTEHVRIQGVVARGHPPEEILRYADNHDISLILMATHGRSGIGRWVMGSVADRVLRASSAPVLLVRASAAGETPWYALPKRTLLVPLDGSELAEQVLPHVQQLSGQAGSRPGSVVLLRVCEPPSILADYPESTMRLTWKEHMEEARALARKEAMEYLVRQEKQLIESGLKARAEVLLGDAAESIIRFANQEMPNIVVMATHGRTGIGRWAYGSVADKILQGSSSPVFLVRPRQRESEIDRI